MRDFFADINWDRWSETIWTHGLRIILIAVAIYVVLRILRHLIDPAVRAAVVKQMQGEPEVEIEKRVDTLARVIHRTIMLVAVVIGLLTILPELGVNIGALLAGAGLVGLAVGFGAQSLVKDMINGMFILVENQYGKGDVVNVAGVGGLVEDVNLRRTVLRDLDGAVHSIPNGEVRTSSNLTRQWSRVNMNVSVAYGEDLERVMAVIDRVGEELAQDPDFAPLIIGAPRALRVDGFGDSGIEIKILGETQPIRQWDVMGELRKRLKKAFDEEGIEIPFPHRVLVTRGAKATEVARRVTRARKPAEAPPFQPGPPEEAGGEEEADS
ncbi:MAG: mechanosensitive ion channel family protein [Dehalococcoidia bacterium]